MPDAIHGSNVVLELFNGLDYDPVLCGTDCTFSRAPEIVRITTTTSGLFPDKMIRREDWSMSVSGLTKIANSSASVTFFYILQTSVRRTRQLVRMTFTDDEGGSKQISGNVLIGNMDINGPQSDFSQCSISFEGTGPFTVADTDPPVAENFDVFSDYWIPANGTNYVDGSSVVHGYNLGATDTPLEVDVEGTEFDLVLASPGNRQCKFNTSTFVTTFAADQIFDGTQRVFIEFKRDL